jgi:hypothetical protein
MTLWEYIFALLECLFDILSAIALNLKVALQKRREYHEDDVSDGRKRKDKGDKERR